MLLTHAFALSASQFVHEKTSLRMYTSMHPGGLELTKLTYIAGTRITCYSTGACIVKTKGIGYDTSIAQQSEKNAMVDEPQQPKMLPRCLIPTRKLKVVDVSGVALRAWPASIQYSRVTHSTNIQESVPRHKPRTIEPPSTVQQ